MAVVRTKSIFDRLSGWFRGELREVRSEGVEPDIPEWSLSRWWDGFGSTGTYEVIWRSQPWVRTAVDFLARNVAQVGLHVFQRVGEGDQESRVRLRDHPFAQVLTTPDPESDPPLTSYRMVYGLVQDLGVFGNGFLLKLPANQNGRQPLRLRRLPARRVREAPDWYRHYSDEPRLVYLRADAREVPLDIRQLVWVSYLSPLGTIGESPIEALRQLLDEYFESAEYRRQLWRNGARVSGWIKRPADAAEWSESARNRFETDWRAHWTNRSSEAGGTPVLEDGMEFNREAWSAEEAQYLEARKLSREEVAAAYFLQPTMIGVTSGATYSNTREHHRMLYQDSLGPLLAGIEQDLTAQLLPDVERWGEVEGVYCEFNIQEKLQGDFEQQTRAFQAAVGRPWMSPNEARSRFNMPRSEVAGADGIATPLNVIVGGQASPLDTAPPPQLALPPAKLALLPGGRKSEVELGQRQEMLASRLSAYFGRQERALAGLEDGESLLELWDGAAWDRELSAELLRHLLAMASISAHDLLEAWAPDQSWSDDALVPWLSAYSGGAAAAINITTMDRIAEALFSPERLALLAALWAWSRGSRSEQIAQTSVTAAVNFGAHDAARAVGLRTKTWRVTSKNPRPSHAQLDGETVRVGEVFSNGGRWPGDGKLPLGERAGCTCVLEFSTEEV